MDLPHKKLDTGACYCYTINNPTYGDFARFRTRQQGHPLNGVVFELFGMENYREKNVIEKRLGIKHTPHLQGMIVFAYKIPWKDLKELFPRAHLETMRDFTASQIYCQKEGIVSQYGSVVDAHRIFNELKFKKLKVRGELKGELDSNTTTLPPELLDQPFFGFEEYKKNMKNPM